MSHKIAQLSLDFPATRSMCVGAGSECAMDANTVEITIKSLKEIRQRLEQAVVIAKVAEACAEAGNIEKGIEAARDVEPLIYEVNTFLNAAGLMNSIAKT
jgi:hypothetical protein